MVKQENIEKRYQRYQMKKLLSVIVYAALAIVVAFPLAVEESHAAFSPRTTVPSYTSQEGKAYYYTDDNVFYKNDLGPNQKYLDSYKGYCVGNCTWYAYGRAGEILGATFNTNFRWSASSWWKINQEGNYYPYGSTPKVGAIACYSTHVAIVEDVIDGQPYVSESAWKVASAQPTDASQLSFHYGTPWQKDLLGYIYITEAVSNTVTDVDYSIQVTIDDLNMRTGPGTDYSSVGYAKKGTYKVSQESGRWIKLADSGYWICIDYVTRVSADTPAVSTVKKSTHYKVKVTTRNLNMRKGPSKRYKRMGYIKRGTYTITRTKNGWGKLKKNGYWIKLSYTTPLNGEYKVKVTTRNLNMRSGPGKLYARKGYIKKGVHTITKTRGNWGQLKSNGYWIKLSYAKKI